MKQDILQMNLYVWIQKLKNILTMPWLEDISEEMLEKLWKIEKQVVNSHVSVFVIQEEPIEIYLPHIFLKRNHMELFYMNQQVLINEINEEWVGIIIFVLREPFDLENIISNGEQILCTSSLYFSDVSGSTFPCLPYGTSLTF